MALFMRRKKEKDLQVMHTHVKNSFSRVRNDITTLNQRSEYYNQWIKYLSHLVHQQDQQIRYLVSRLREVPDHDALHRIVKEHDRYEEVVDKVQQVSARVDYIASHHEPLRQRLDTHHERLTKLETQGTDVRKQKITGRLMKKISRNSKEYIRSIVMSLISKYQRITGLQLRDIVVEEQGLCSKSTFYRILSEIETSGEVSVAQDGKDKVYFLNIVNDRQT